MENTLWARCVEIQNEAVGDIATVRVAALFQFSCERNAITYCCVRNSIDVSLAAGNIYIYIYVYILCIYVYNTVYIIYIYIYICYIYIYIL